jgi:hypothetical protein
VGKLRAFSGEKLSTDNFRHCAGAGLATLARGCRGGSGGAGKRSSPTCNYNSNFVGERAFASEK